MNSGDLHGAQRVTDRMVRAQVQPSSKTYRALLQASSEAGFVQIARHTFQKIKSIEQDDTVCLLRALARVGCESELLAEVDRAKISGHAVDPGTVSALRAEARGNHLSTEKQREMSRSGSSLDGVVLHLAELLRHGNASARTIGEAILRAADLGGIRSAERVLNIVK